QPRRVGHYDVVAVLVQPGIHLSRMGLTDRGTEDSHVLATQISDPTADPVTGVEGADDPVAAADAVFVKSCRLKARRVVQLVVAEIGALGPPRRARRFKNGLRLPANKILSGKAQQVFRRGENVPQVFRPGDSRGIDPAFVQLASEKLLVSSCVKYNFLKPLGLDALNDPSGQRFPPTSEGRNRAPHHHAFDESARFPEHSKATHGPGENSSRWAGAGRRSP